MSNGKVFLIGVGPGDPELLALKAVRCLATLAEATRVSDLGSPALVVIGRVVGPAQLIGQVELLRRVA